ncbi:hypothetical protein GGP69_003350 [Salinibacter ruber]|nr:hypothetical protein [Salinibacter ruber]
MDLSSRGRERLLYSSPPPCTRGNSLHAQLEGPRWKQVAPYMQG